MVKPETLEGLDAFTELVGAARERVCSYLVAARYQAGETVFEEGEPGMAAFFITSGSAQVSRRTERGTQKLLSRIRAGQMLGEMALLDGGPRSARASSLGETVVLVLTREEFNRLLADDPHAAALILKRIARTLSLRLRQTNAMVS